MLYEIVPERSVRVNALGMLGYAQQAGLSTAIAAEIRSRFALQERGHGPYNLTHNYSLCLTDESVTGLPAGMSLSAAGVLGGKPTGFGTFTGRFTVADGSSPRQTVGREGI